jgi:hypothetical protein
MASCLLRRDATGRPPSHGNHVPYRTVVGNLLPNRHTSNRSVQECVPDLASPEQESLADCDKGTAGKYQEAYSASLLASDVNGILHPAKEVR